MQFTSSNIMLTRLHGDFYIFWVILIGLIPYHGLTLWSFRESLKLIVWTKCDFIEYRQVWILIYFYEICKILHLYEFWSFVYSIGSLPLSTTKSSNPRLRVLWTPSTYVSTHMKPCTKQFWYQKFPLCYKFTIFLKLKRFRQSFMI